MKILQKKEYNIRLSKPYLVIIIAIIFIFSIAVEYLEANGCCSSWYYSKTHSSICSKRNSGNTSSSTPSGESSSSGGSSSSSGVSAEQAAYNAAVQREAEARAYLATLENASRSEIRRAEEELRRAKEAVAETYNTLKRTQLIGDPVLVSTGRFVLEATDIEIPGMAGISRKYVSEERTAGSFGAGWLAAQDSRIIRGTTSVDEAALQEIGRLINQIQTAIGRISTRYTNAIAVANRARNNILQPARSRQAELQAVQERSRELSALNALSRFPGAPEYFEGSGNGNLVLIDESGAPGVYEPAGSGVWIPVNYPQRLYERLESKDGGGAESTGGFIHYGRGGVRREYCGNGLLVKVTELNGNSIEYIRDSRGRVMRIEGPHGNRWEISYSGNFISRISGPEGRGVRYGYSGNELSWVQDTDGDTSRYVYEDGRLTEIIKPDGSKIKLEYGLEAEGRRLVTSTTHEEGAAEKFEYNLSARTTTYTNHSGVVTRFRYDERHRTVEEVNSDGTVKTFSYNASDQIASETINGFTITYTYDSRGNISQKAYGDGTRENWTWNGSDQPVSYTDRDGVVTRWGYDGRGNCIQITRGGQEIYSAGYDARNRITWSKEGERTEARYGYNAQDFIISRSVTQNMAEITERWERDALGRITRYTDGAGREWRYTHTAKETVEQTPAGLVRRYEYNNRKQLVRVLERDIITGEEREVNVVYDRRHLPLEVTDGAGNITKFAYRADGEVVRREQGPWFWEYVYEAGGRISEVIRGREGSEERYRERYDYNRHGGGTQTRTVTRPESQSASFVINPFGHVTSVTNALGETSTRTVNGAGNAVREQGASGGYYEYRYDSSGRVIEAGRENERGVQVRYNRDGTISQKTDRLGNVTRYVYDGRGQLLREITALGEERYYYDAAGRITRRETVSRNSSGGYFTTWGYNDSERTVTITAGGVYRVTLHLNAWGEVVRREDGEGNVQRYEYDGSGSLIRTIDGYERATGYEWNEIGKIERITYTDNMTEEYEYDHTGNLIKITDALGTAWSGEYDGAGRLRREIGRPGIEREYRYDALGRITEVRSGGEVTERYRYTARGREIAFTDGAGGEFRQQRNAYGELVNEINRAGDMQGYAYDAEGRLTRITAYSGNRTSVEYRDSEGLTITTYSDGTQNIIERDKAGNIIRVSGVTGTIRYRYDAGGMLAEQNDEGAGEITRYAYNRAGLRTRMASGNRDVHYQYGRNGELLRVADAGQRLEVSYEYDVRGRETRRTFGNGVRQETQYDAIGRVVMIREHDAQNRLLRAEGYLYDDKGRRSHSVDEEGRVTKYEYDRQSRLAGVLYPWTSEKAQADRKEAERAGLFFMPERGIGERYMLSGGELSELRNVLNRAAPSRGNIINSAQMMWRESYTYDRNGNRASKTTPWGTIRYEYDAENRLVRKGDIVYENDKDGNMIRETGTRHEARYVYNGQNRMVYSEVTDSADRTQTVTFYGYDALGRRTLTENAAGQMMRTMYDGRSFEVIREGETFRDGSLTTRFTNGTMAGTSAGMPPGSSSTGERYRWTGDGGQVRSAAEEAYAAEGGRFGTRGITLYGRGEAVAVSYGTSTGSRSMYLGKDIMGSVRTATGESGRLEDRYEYDVFGTPYTGDLSGGMNLGYMSKPFNSSTGLYNYGFRDYKPQAARFTTVDPIRDGNNWFVYVNNDPVNFIDLWGLCATDLRQEGRSLTPEEMALYTTASGGLPIDFNQITVIERQPTSQEVLNAVINAGLDPFSYPVELIGYITQAPASSFPGGIIYLPLDARGTDHEQLALAVHEIHHQQTYQSGNPGQVFEQLIREADLATRGKDVYNTLDHPHWYLENEAQQIEKSVLIILRKPI